MNVIYDNEYIVGVILPDSLTSIGDYAFSRCSKLESVVIPARVTSIGNYAFSSCSKLASVGIPADVTDIGYGAFGYCSSLESVTIPAGATIESSAFQFCSKLLFTVSGTGSYSTLDEGKMLIKDGKELAAYPSASGAVELPGSITSIGRDAFYQCSSLTGITIPSSVTSIGMQAFSFCSGLTAVTVPATVTSIGTYAFYSCSNLTSITIPAGATIESSAFQFCSKLLFTVSGTGSYSASDDGKMLIKDGKELAAYPSANGAVTTLPNSITAIGNNAFYSNNSLTSVAIPSGVTSIGNYAFYNCSNLTSVTIPSSVDSIGESTFSRCSSLESVTFAAGSSISAANFDAGSIDYPTFPGDLRAKYLGMGGGAGRYTTTRQSNDNTTAVWTKTPQ
jgi:hypothetical protein